MTTLTTLLAPLGLGLFLGLRHAFEPDHLAAVSTLATRQGHLAEAARLGLVWGLGHTASVGGVTLGVVVAGLRLSPAFQPVAELAVAALLVLLGLPVVLRYARGRWHMHLHSHAGGGGGGGGGGGDDARHLHLHSHAGGPSHAHAHARWDLKRAAGFGVVHGLAGSAAFVVLLVAGAGSVPERAAYFAAFGAGTIAGMLGVSLSLGAVVRVAARHGARWAAALHLGAAAASVAVGLVLAGRVVSER